jgi:purine-nucleoside phosphorylase
MSLHIGAAAGAIAERVLMPGDPRRAEWIATNFLDDATRYTDVRNMWGFTGTFRGERVSVQAHGMGLPSVSIYAHELFAEYGVRVAFRIGTCGALRPEIALRDLILASGASTDSSINRLRFGLVDYAAVADFGALQAAHRVAVARDLPVHVGTVLSSDLFYDEDEAHRGALPSTFDLLARWNTLAVEMEASALYSLAARHGVRALTLLTVTDQLITHEALPAIERETTLRDMVETALDALLEVEA